MEKCDNLKIKRRTAKIEHYSCDVQLMEGAGLQGERYFCLLCERHSGKMPKEDSIYDMVK